MRDEILFRFYPWFTLFFLGNSGNAQVSEGGIPYAWETNLSSADIPMVSMSELDMASLVLEDEQDALDNLPPRFGYPHDVQLDLSNSGTWKTLANGDALWQLKIHCPAAGTINLNYDDFYMPGQSKFFIYSEDKSHLMGAYTSFNNKVDRQFATGFAYGETIVLEYYEPATVAGQGSISISQIIHGYRSVGSLLKGFGDSGSCNNDVNCPEASGWQETKKSVALLLSGNFRFCTGALINDAGSDCTPYLLTANHCIGGNATGNPVSYIFVFNYESPSCAGGDGSTSQSVQGAFLRAKAGPSDFALFELDDNPADFYDVHFAGWNRENQTGTPTVAIHHPSGDVKKISWEMDPLTSTTYSSSNINPNGTHWRIIDWEDGTTEGGSSGSPIFNADHQIIGQLHGGGAACGNNLSDWYGKIWYSWDQNSSNSNQSLKSWLDPDNTGITELNGTANSCASSVPSCSDGVQNQGETGIDCGGTCPEVCECTDGVQNNGELGVDCGGVCEPCTGLVNVKLKFFLEGAMLSTGFMNKDLLNNNLLPLAQPYSVEPYNYGGGEAMPSYSDFPASTVDWVLIEARDINDSNIVLDRRAALLKSDGRVMETNGSLGVNFANINSGSAYRLVIYHRNHMGVMSSVNVNVPNSSQYDFSTSIFKAEGSGQMIESNGKVALHAGDFDGNGNLNILDFLAWFNDNAAVNAYVPYDSNMSGVVNIVDFLFWFNNSSTVAIPEVQL